MKTRTNKEFCPAEGGSWVVGCDKPSLCGLFSALGTFACSAILKELINRESEVREETLTTYL